MYLRLRRTGVGASKAGVMVRRNEPRLAVRTLHAANLHTPQPFALYTLNIVASDARHRWSLMLSRVGARAVQKARSQKSEDDDVIADAETDGAIRVCVCLLVCLFHSFRSRHGTAQDTQLIMGRPGAARRRRRALAESGGWEDRRNAASLSGAPLRSPSHLGLCSNYIHPLVLLQARADSSTDRRLCNNTFVPRTPACRCSRPLCRGREADIKLGFAEGTSWGETEMLMEVGGGKQGALPKRGRAVISARNCAPAGV